jgi:putative transposase
MKTTRFGEQQVALLLRQAEEGTSVGEVCRKAGNSATTIYNWRKKYIGLMPLEMNRLKQLGEENRRQKKLVADLSPDKEMPRGTSSAEKYEASPEAGDGRTCSPPPAIAIPLPAGRPGPGE